MKHLDCRSAQGKAQPSLQGSQKLTVGKSHVFQVQTCHSRVTTFSIAWGQWGKCGRSMYSSTCAGFQGSELGPCSHLCSPRLGVCKCVGNDRRSCESFKKSFFFSGIFFIFESIYCSLLNTHIARRGQVQPGSLLPGAAFLSSQWRRGEDQPILLC